MSLITITPPAVEPLTAADMAIPARLDSSEFDAHINSVLIPAFRATAEHQLGRRLITQTVELVLDHFPVDDIDLILPDVQTIVSVKYIDSAGSQQTLLNTSYGLDADSLTCWLLPVSAWPATYDCANAVRVRYTVGYGPAGSDVPQTIRTWIMAHVCQALDNPAAIDTANLQTLPYLDRLLDAERIWRCS